jgi:hypothetical protein
LRSYSSCRLNLALHTIVLARLRDDPETRVYATRRKTKGKTSATSAGVSLAEYRLV